MTAAARPPATSKTPQDHKPKASAGFTFDHDGVTYSIPAPSAALAAIDGRTFRDAMLGGDVGELKLGFVCLELACTDKPTLDALYAKPAGETAKIIGEWFQSADLSGATLPQS